MKISRAFAVMFIMLFLVPQFVSAEDVHQKIEITIMPKEAGNYTKLYNIVDANNSWLDNRNMWKGFRTDGRIVGEGIIPNPLKINDYENDSGTAKLSIISVKYLDTYDIMSGTSDSYIRLPLAVNESSYSSNITMLVKIYEIEGDTYNITDFNYTSVKYSTYAASYLLYNYESKISAFKDISTQNYTYPSNITNLTLRIFYLHLRAPILAKSTYILLQYLEIPNAKKDPIYLLSSYENATGYYYSAGEIKSIPYPPSWSMLAKYGMSEGIYSTNIPYNKWYFEIYKENLAVKIFDKVYVSFAIPAYSNKTANLTITLQASENNYSTSYSHTETEHLSPGMNNIFVLYNFTVTENGTIDRFTVSLNSTNGADIYIYLIRDVGGKIYYSDIGNNIYYYASSILNYHFLSKTTYITFQSFHFEGLQEPIIKYNTKYVYSLLDLPILLYKYEMYMVTNTIYFLTFGQVDLRYLYSDNFILSIAKGARAVFDWIAYGPIGIFLRTVIDFIVSGFQLYGWLVLQFLIFAFNIVAYFVFLWPWLVLYRGFDILQRKGVDALLDYWSAYVDRATNIMAKLIFRKGVNK